MERSDLREAVRATAAHSTLVVSDVSSARFVAHKPGGPDWHRRMYAGPRKLVVAAAQPDANLSVLASHDGYGARFGFLHRRQLVLAPGGALLSGRDELVANGRTAKGAALDYALRFHLHPAVQVTLTEAADGARLDLPAGTSWYFSAEGLTVELEDSVYLGSPHGAVRSRQLVVQANTATCASINWSLQRYEDAPEPEPDLAAS